MRAEIFDRSGQCVATLDASPVCGRDFCDTCGDCLYCYSDDCNSGEYCGRARWVLETPVDDELIAQLGAAPREVSARDDFPWPTNDSHHAIKQHGIMCRTIDSLRAVTLTLQSQVDTLTAWKREALQVIEAWDRCYLDEIDRLRAERDTLTAENAELQNEYDEVWDGREALRVALVAWKRARAKSRRDWSEPQAMAALLDMVPADYWGLAPREEGKQ